MVARMAALLFLIFYGAECQLWLGRGAPASAVAAEDRRVQAAPDRGKFTAFPPVVRRAPTAVPMAQDVREDEEWGGRLPLMARARSMGGSMRTGFVHGFYDFCLPLALSLGQKKELVHVYEASYASEFLTLI